MSFLLELCDAERLELLDLFCHHCWLSASFGTTDENVLDPDVDDLEPRLAGVTTVLDPRYPIVGVSLPGGFGEGPPIAALDGRTFPVTEFGMVTSFGA